jgi:membrane associated rhomboid family serine protease
VFPLRDENPTSTTTWMTWLLVGTNLAAFGYEVFVLMTQGPAAFEVFVRAWAFDPARFAAQPGSPMVWATLLTSMFLHANLLHVGGNMLYLWIFGNNIEDRLGPFGFLAFYVVCGLAATGAQTLATGLVDVVNLGASGAIAGVLGAYLLLYPRARVQTAIFIVFFFEIALLPAWVLILLWFALQVASGLATFGTAASAGGVAYFAHVGGFVAGLALILPVWLRDSTRARFTTWR